MEILVATIGLLFVSAIIYFFYIAEAHEAGPWQKKRTILMALAKEYGLEVEDSGEKAVGTLEGVPFAIGIASVQCSKSKIIELWARLELPDCPESLSLRSEDLLTGIGRIFGSEELSLGDPEFDAAFEVGGESVEQVKSYLTPEVRSGFLRFFTKLPEARLKERSVHSGKRFTTPFFMTRHFRPLLENNSLLASAVQGRIAPLQADESSGVVEGKIRLFALWTLPLWLALFVLTLSGAETSNQWASTVALGVGTLMSAGALTASEIARVALQGFYAFMSLFTALLLVLGVLHGTEIYEPRLLNFIDQEYTAFFLFVSIALLGFWGARNYLRGLDQTRVVVNDAKKENCEL
jgi:fumarate reductase subunit D